MVVVMSIGQAERRWESRQDIDESWVSQQVNQRTADGVPICVQVRMSFPDSGVSITVISRDCPGGRAGGTLTPNEAEIVQRWRELVLAHNKLVGGRLVAFLKGLPWSP